MTTEREETILLLRRKLAEMLRLAQELGIDRTQLQRILEALKVVN
jgi:hypothetical protein